MWQFVLMIFFMIFFGILLLFDSIKIQMVSSSITDNSSIPDNDQSPILTNVNRSDSKNSEIEIL